MENFHFKVNLKGMIDLLSNHLYSTPQVYIRELIQNAVDAITARKNIDPSHEGKIGIELFHYSDKAPTLYLEDNGVGLTEEEIHLFLSQIGQTSKNGRDDQGYIGRFGVGLLSCFIVSDEIVLLTRSIKSDKTYEWRGKPDGSYALKKLDTDMAPGTRIYLQSKEGFERFFESSKVKELVNHYGGFLPYPILFHGEKPILLNEEKAPWDMTPVQALVFGKKMWDLNFLDAIPLSSSLGEAKGIAYILPHSIRVQAKKTHRVYVKQMLLSEQVEKILPDWAFFVTCVLNVDQLKPTVSREEFYDDAMLELVRNELGECIKRYLIRLATEKPDLLQEIIRIHYSSIKLLAKEDQELFSLFIKWLPFETSMGRQTVNEILQHSSRIYYTTTVDEFRQMQKVAKAQNLCVVNGGYVNDAELIENLGHVFLDVVVEKLDPSTLLQNFTELTLPEKEEVHEFIRFANVILQPYQCSCEVKKFQPQDLPVLYTTNEEAQFLRSTQQTKEESNPLFASILEQMTTNQLQIEYAQICFNYDHPMIQKIIRSSHPERKKQMIEMLYVQALLLGHHPLRQQEMKLLNHGLMHMMEWGLPS